MDVIILAGGYATRLRPLTLNMSKPLLKVAGRPIVDYLLDKVDELDGVERVFVVGNEKFHEDYEEWVKDHQHHSYEVIPLNDSTTSNEDRLGAVGDIRFGIEKGGITDDCMVLGGDNLFDFSLAQARAFQKKMDMPAIVCFDVERKDLVSLYSEARITDGIVTDFVEKPPEPETTLAGVLIYLLRAKDLNLVGEYLDEGNGADNAGSFIQWLVQKTSVAGYAVSGRWLDIGTKEEYDRANAMWR